MVSASHHRFDFAEYVELEAASSTKHEFLNGRVFAMAGGSPEHAAVTANVARLIGNALVGKTCRVYSPDLRVRVPDTGLGTYPDVTVVCGKVEFDPSDPKKLTITNPIVLVEVLSPSTEDYDRGEKLGHYKHIRALQEVVFVAHDRNEIEIVRRETDGSWSRHVARDGEIVRIVSLGYELSVSEVYANPLAG